MKVEGKDILNPVFSETSTSANADAPVQISSRANPDVCLTKEGIGRIITVKELESQDKQKPWVCFMPFNGTLCFTALSVRYQGRGL